ncbi:MAG: hypothetical protein NT175_04020 [Bacteroidetes bacterium]|nr:hypothetical protein [Bacteroidota bacterium]
MKSFEFSFEELQIGTADIEQMLGYDPGFTPMPITETINDVIKDAASHSSIKGGYLIFDDVVLNKEHHTLTVRDMVFDIQKNVYQNIRQSTQVAFFLCTAGKGMSDWSKSLMNDGQILKGYIVDVLGTIIVESAMISIHIHLKKAMEVEGLNLTNRYNPGYCGWNVLERYKLFSFFPERFCGITLSNNGFMNPPKSVSGIIGIGERVKYNPYDCGLCKMKNCMYRTYKE